jgi:hypothetical protein
MVLLRDVAEDLEQIVPSRISLDCAVLTLRTGWWVSPAIHSIVC